jgi:para-nitrobenzyl esterase
MNQNTSGMNRRTALQTAIGIAVVVPSAVSARTSEISTPAKNPVVETTNGKARGFTNAGVAVFRGIPYGASTTGPNRFMPPVKPEPWSGVRNCFSYGHSCPEAGTGVIENDSNARNTDEDEYLLYRTQREPLDRNGHGWTLRCHRRTGVASRGYA